MTCAFLMQSVLTFGSTCIKLKMTKWPTKAVTGAPPWVNRPRGWQTCWSTGPSISAGFVPPDWNSSTFNMAFISLVLAGLRKSLTILKQPNKVYSECLIHLVVLSFYADPCVCVCMAILSCCPLSWPVYTFFTTFFCLNIS